ncbi:MAG: Rieske 2Fe-2S domain-containing protein [Actinobacteria bacterium]|jgi:thiosulfate dehydrogenase [quinone] large subunit|nr:Rieske 2Fe-2S domain-containing protein [Actinomycetota bacterium]
MANYSFSRTWQSQPMSARVIRLFLGITWIYGGWNKATDAGFLNSASPHYIGEQLKGYLTTSPIHAILQHMVEHASLMGWGVMLSEFAIGIATLLGIAGELAALGGFSMSIILWLSATWSVKPYFLGSDTAYAILWLALFLSIRQSARSRRITSIIPNLKDRREVVRLIGVGAASVVAAFAGKKFTTTNPTPEAGAAIATLADLPVGATKNFQAADGRAAIVFRTKAGVFAYARICTHQGCVADYDSASHLIKCPCHGAAFDPTNGGAAVAGPTQIALDKIKVAIKGNNIVQI